MYRYLVDGIIIFAASRHQAKRKYEEKFNSLPNEIAFMN